MRRRTRSLSALLLSLVLFLGLSTYLLPRADPSRPAGSSDSPPTVVSTSAPAEAAECVPGLSPGTSTVQVELEGARYPVRVHLPGDADGTGTAAGSAGSRSGAGQAGSAPGGARPALVLDLHGSDANGVTQAQISGMDDVADAHGFIVAEPDAAIALDSTNPLPDGNWAWNVPGVPLAEGNDPPQDARDDVAFLAAVVNHLTQVGCADPQRVYATGFSGGGRMASALACARPDLVAAIAPVAGLRAGRVAQDDAGAADPVTCDPANGVPVITFHGTDDWVNPYEGSTDSRWGYPLTTALERWAELNRCSDQPVETPVSEHVTLTSYTGCHGDSGDDGDGGDGRASVQGYTVLGGGHTWPGTAVDLSSLGTTTQEISASELMWDFFAEHPGRTGDNQEQAGPARTR